MEKEAPKEAEPLRVPFNLHNVPIEGTKGLIAGDIYKTADNTLKIMP